MKVLITVVLLTLALLLMDRQKPDPKTKLLTTRECIGCYLENADLQGLDLQGVNLEKAN